jgi:hypothetical protein
VMGPVARNGRASDVRHVLRLPPTLRTTGTRSRAAPLRPKRKLLLRRHDLNMGAYLRRSTAARAPTQPVLWVEIGEIPDQVDRGQSCEFGISRETGYVWLRRYRSACTEHDRDFAAVDRANGKAHARGLFRSD